MSRSRRGAGSCAAWANDFAGLENLAFLASNEWYANTGMRGHTMRACSHFVAAGMDVRAEESTARGRLTVLYNGNVYLFEFKVADGKGRALGRKRGYADKCGRPGVPVHMVEFGREERNIVGFETV